VIHWVVSPLATRGFQLPTDRGDIHRPLSSFWLPTLNCGGVGARECLSAAKPCFMNSTNSSTTRLTSSEGSQQTYVTKTGIAPSLPKRFPLRPSLLDVGCQVCLQVTTRDTLQSHVTLGRGGGVTPEFGRALFTCKKEEMPVR
jgi:hypothetical protein